MNRVIQIDKDNSGWRLISDKDDEMILQSAVRSSFYRKLNFDDEGNITEVYTDVKRVICIDIGTSEKCIDPLACKVLDELYPISLPYQVVLDDEGIPQNKVKMYIQRFKYDMSSDSLDTFGVLYLQFPCKKLEAVYRFFKKEGFELVETTKEEYFNRLYSYEQSIQMDVFCKVDIETTNKMVNMMRKEGK